MEQKQQKIDTLSKIIEVKRELEETKKIAIDAKLETMKLSRRLDVVESDSNEHRKNINHIKRSVWEVVQIAMGNKKQVEALSHRAEDTEERFDRIEEIMTWTMRGIVGLFLTTLVGAILKFVLGA